MHQRDTKAQKSFHKKKKKKDSKIINLRQAAVAVST